MTQNTIETNTDNSDFDPDSMLEEPISNTEKINGYEYITYVLGYPDIDVTFRARLFHFKMTGDRVSKLVVSANPERLKKVDADGSIGHVRLQSATSNNMNLVSRPDQCLTGVSYYREKYSEPVMVLKFS